MKDTEITDLFTKVADRPSSDREGLREVFSMLIRTTLLYRDRTLASEGIIVTVEHVRTALDWLVPCLETGRFPETDNRISLNLLKIWFDELKPPGNLEASRDLRKGSP